MDDTALQAPGNSGQSTPPTPPTPPPVTPPPTGGSSGGGQVGSNQTNIPTSQIQTNLGVASDNQYGPQTTQAVMQFQQANGLQVDGIFGPQTMAAYNQQYGTGGGANNGSGASGGSTGQGTGAPTTPQTPEQQLAAANQAYDDEYNKVSTSITNIQNGSVPLSEGEQAQITALQNEFKGLIEQQKLANISAGGTANIRGYQTGSAEYDPTFQTKTIGTIITAGLNKVADLNIKMAGAVAQLEQSFQDDDIKAIKEAWSMYSDYSNHKTDALNKTIDDAYQKMKDDRDYKMEQEKFALEKEKTYAEINKIKNSGGLGGLAGLGSGTLATNIKTSMAAIRFPSVADRATAENAIAGLLASGDIEGTIQQIRTYAFNAMGADDQQKLAGKDDAISALATIQKNMAELEAQGINTNFFTGLKQKTLEKGGFLADPTLNETAENIALAIIDYRRAVSGAAFTESEGAAYEALFPSAGNTPELNKVKIETLMEKFQRDIDSAYSRKIPKYGDMVGTLNEYMNNPGGLDPVNTGGTNPNDPEGLY